MNNILITGINGFVGSHLAKKLLNENHNVVGIIRDINNNKMLKHLEIDNHKNLTLVHGDVLEKDTVKRTIIDYSIDTIYHLAAQSIVKNALKDPVTTYNTNVMGTVNLLTICTDEIIKSQISNIVIASTDKIYGKGFNKKENSYLNEENNGTYESSKICEDVISYSFKYTHNLPIAICRPCNIYGFDFNKRIIPNTIRQCMNGESPIIFSNIKGLREYIYINDIVDAYTSVAKYREINNKEFIFNIGTGEIISQENLVLLIIKVYNELFRTNIIPSRCVYNDNLNKEIDEQSVNSDLIKNIVKWKPKYNLHDGLTETINEFRKWRQLE